MLGNPEVERELLLLSSSIRLLKVSKEKLVWVKRWTISDYIYIINHNKFEKHQKDKKDKSQDIIIYFVKIYITSWGDILLLKSTSNILRTVLRTVGLRTILE